MTLYKTSIEEILKEMAAEVSIEKGEPYTPRVLLPPKSLRRKKAKRKGKPANSQHKGQKRGKK